MAAILQVTFSIHFLQWKFLYCNLNFIAICFWEFKFVIIVSDNGMVLNRQQAITLTNDDQGAVSIRKTVLPGMAIPMLKIRRPNGRLIFNMEIAIRR